MALSDEVIDLTASEDDLPQPDDRIIIEDSEEETEPIGLASDRRNGIHFHQKIGSNWKRTGDFKSYWIFDKKSWIPIPKTGFYFHCTQTGAK